MSGKYGRLVMIGLALIGASLIGNAALYAFGVSPFNTKSIHETQSVSADGVSRILIRSGDVRVVAGGGDRITATVEGRTGRLQQDGISLTVGERSGELVIEASREVKRRLISFNPGEYELLVEVPDRKLAYVEVATVAADIAVERVRADQFMLRAVHGEIETSGLSGSVSARTDAGDIELGVRAIEGVIHAETKLGDIGVVTEEAPEKVSLDMQTRLGEQDVDLPGTAIVTGVPDAPSVWLSAEAGDLKVRKGR